MRRACSEQAWNMDDCRSSRIASSWFLLSGNMFPMRLLTRAQELSRQGTRTLKKASWTLQLRLDSGLKQTVKTIMSIYNELLVLSCCNWSFTR